ncbi:MAG: 3-hydroxyacyl-CoA dehydrogenase NAD-binding domain-containing protein, partial [Syntrophorhabdales bacterium]
IFAEKGWRVSLTDVDESILARALQGIRANLTLLAKNGIGGIEDVEPALSRVKTTLRLEEAVADAGLVIEAVAERLDLKQELFRKLDAMCPAGTILATNTSVISITEIAAKSEDRRRIVGTHFWNPPYLVPLVEVVPGTDTSTDVVDSVYDLLKKAGKHPVKVRRDVPGFVGNRLQHALWREAISIVDQGIADAATVDEVIKNGFGIRLPVLGPLETADMVGLDLTLQIHDYILPHLDRSTGPAPILRSKVEKGEIGFKAGRGFEEWSNEAIEECRRRLLNHLIAWTKQSR